MNEVIRGSHATLEEEVTEAQVILFCLPVNPHHEIASRIGPYLAKGSLCLTIAKGLDEAGRTAAQVFDSGGQGVSVAFLTSYTASTVFTVPSIPPA